MSHVGTGVHHLVMVLTFRNSCLNAVARPPAFSSDWVCYLSVCQCHHCQSSHQPQFVTYLPSIIVTVNLLTSPSSSLISHYRHCQSSHQPQFVIYLHSIIVTVSLLTSLSSSLISHYRHCQSSHQPQFATYLPLSSLSVFSPASFRHLSLFQCHHCQSCHQPHFVTYLSSSAITVSLVTSLSSSLISLPVPSLSALSPASVRHLSLFQCHHCQSCHQPQFITSCQTLQS